MTFRPGRTGVISAAGVLALLPAVTSHAAPPLPAPEKSLLGISLLGSYKDVLHKYGQPTQIQAGSPSAPTPPPAAAGQRGSMGAGGFPGMMGGMMRPGMGGGPPMMGGKMGAMMGAGGMGMMRPGMGGGPPMMGGGAPMMGGGPPGMGGGLPGFAGGKMGGMMGAGGMGGPMGMMRPGMGGGPPMMGGMMPGMGGGLPGGALTRQNSETSESTWWYNDPAHGRYYSFLFNHDGRVIQIQEYGWKGGGPTRQGIGLGSPLGQLVKRYGWSDQGEHSGDTLSLEYGGPHRLAFQLVNNQVVGITLGVIH